MMQRRHSDAFSLTHQVTFVLKRGGALMMACSLVSHVAQTDSGPCNFMWKWNSSEYCLAVTLLCRLHRHPLQNPMDKQKLLQLCAAALNISNQCSELAGVEAS